MASNSQQPANTPQPQQNPQQMPAAANIISALGQALKSQTGEPLHNDKIAHLLLQNMTQLSELARMGKLNKTQIEQVDSYYLHR